MEPIFLKIRINRKTSILYPLGTGSGCDNLKAIGKNLKTIESIQEA